jgi:hypothetical protein
MPFIGRGDNPPNSPVDVYVTAYLDRLLEVDDKAYTFAVRDQQHAYVGRVLRVGLGVWTPVVCWGPRNEVEGQRDQGLGL